MAFVIALEKPIRQGNQKYSNLVIETHKVEHTIHINLTEQEIASKYEGLSPQMTMPMSSLIAKIFKIISQKKVFIPKQFKSARDAYCVKCSLKANDGLLYPLAKSFIFIHKPTVIIGFDDIDFVEFKRYEPVSNYGKCDFILFSPLFVSESSLWTTTYYFFFHPATRNFDLSIVLKNPEPGEPKEYTFITIDRTEYSSLFDYVKAKELKIKNPQEAGPAAKSLAELDLGEDDGGDDDEEDEEDDDYEGACVRRLAVFLCCGCLCAKAIIIHCALLRLHVGVCASFQEVIPRRAETAMTAEAIATTMMTTKAAVATMMMRPLPRVRRLALLAKYAFNFFC